MTPEPAAAQASLAGRPRPRRFRFAPTPSRPLHLGSAFAALVGEAAARQAGGTFVLRIEDIDRTRCLPAFEAQVLEDLRWLGLTWEEGPDVGGPAGPYRQSERFDRYDAALERLLAAGLAYPCECSRASVREHQSAPHLLAGGELPYPGTCRPPQRAPWPGAQGGLRLDIDALGARARVGFRDRWQGPVGEDVRHTCGDLLLGRPGLPGYHLAAVLDDREMGITDVVRGRDLLGSTARQRLLHRALAETEPAPERPPRPFPRTATPHGPPGDPSPAHHPLLLAPDGRKLSKRDGDLSLASLRADGVRPGGLIAALGRAAGWWGGAVKSATVADVAAALPGSGAWPWADIRLPEAGWTGLLEGPLPP